jgi:DNA (cytosine-5)-methyltransferase 1
MEAATAAVERTGIPWDPVAFSEIEPAACAVLSARYPSVPNLGDMCAVDWSAWRGRADVIVGGPPCQDFSLAGKRAGLAGKRGNLSLEYLNVLDQVRPRWALYENVPGLLHSNKSRDFSAFLGQLAELGYTAAFRVLDAKYFGVPQRRRRLFIALHLGDWLAPATVLALAEGGGGGHASGAEQGQGTPAAAPGSPAQYDFDGLDLDALTGWMRPATRRSSARIDDSAQNAHIALSVVERPRGVKGNTSKVAEWIEDEAYALMNPGDGGRADDRIVVHADVFNFKVGPIGQTLRAATDGSGTHQGCVLEPLAADTRTCTVGGIAQAVRFGNDSADGSGCALEPVAFRQPAFGHYVADGTTSSLLARDSRGPNDAVVYDQRGDGATVPPLMAAALRGPGDPEPFWICRRLTPGECLSLQGFDHDWIDAARVRGKPLADTARYKLIGNSWAVPVASWILERMDAVDRHINQGIQA